MFIICFISYELWFGFLIRNDIYFRYYYLRNRIYFDGKSSYIDLIGGKWDMNYILYIFILRILVLSFVFGIRLSFIYKYIFYG